jgi:hypothetical protein
MLALNSWLLKNIVMPLIETPPNDGTWLPEPIPIEYFSLEFYGHVALRYWQDRSLVELQDAVVPAAEVMPESALLAASEMILDDNTEAIEACAGSLKVWKSARALGLDPNTKIRKVHKNRINILTFLRDLDTQLYGYSVNELDFEILEAAEGFRGETYATSFLRDRLTWESVVRARRRERQRQGLD